MSRAGPLLAVEGLRVRFRTRGALRALLARDRDPFVDAVLDVSLALDPGRTLALVGESGSGKTTLGRAVLGLVPAQAGTVRLGGADLSAGTRRVPSAFRREAAFVFQDPVASLSPRMRVGALLSEPFAIHRVKSVDRPREVGRLLDLVALPATFAGRYPHELSGGQARRVGVARALALSPRFIIADEPTSGLDVSAASSVLNLMKDLGRQLGLTYLIITHNLNTLGYVADRIAVMYLGRIVEVGTAEAIFGRPSHPYTRALLSAVPEPD